MWIPAQGFCPKLGEIAPLALGSLYVTRKNNLNLWL